MGGEPFIGLTVKLLDQFCRAMERVIGEGFMIKYVGIGWFIQAPT